MRLWDAHVARVDRARRRRVPDPVAVLIALGVQVPSFCAVEAFGWWDAVTLGDWLFLPFVLCLPVLLAAFTRRQWRRETARVESWLGPNWKQISRPERKRMWAEITGQPPPGRWFPLNSSGPYFPPG
jgi:hypothetical protein